MALCQRKIPAGKIYPILTHGRQTEVHVQMTNVARQVYLNFVDTEMRRLDEYGVDMVHADEENQTAFESRRGGPILLVTRSLMIRFASLRSYRVVFRVQPST